MLVLLASCTTNDDTTEQFDEDLITERVLVEETAEIILDSDIYQTYETPILILYKKGTSEERKEVVRKEFVKNPYVRLTQAIPCPDNKDVEIWICNVSPKTASGKPGGAQQAGSKDPIQKAAAMVTDCNYDFEIDKDTETNESLEE